MSARVFLVRVLLATASLALTQGTIAQAVPSTVRESLAATPKAASGSVKASPAPRASKAAPILLVQETNTQAVLEQHFQGRMNRAAFLLRMSRDAFFLSSLGVVGTFLTFPALANIGLLTKALAWDGIKAGIHIWALAGGSSFLSAKYIQWLGLERRRVTGVSGESLEDRVNQAMLRSDLASLLRDDLHEDLREHFSVSL